MLLVVSRYFGGTKLGKGPLARAYQEAGAAALEEATIVSARLAERFQLWYPYPATGTVRSVIERVGGEILDQGFDELGRVVVVVSRERLGDWQALLGGLKGVEWKHVGPGLIAASGRANSP